MKKIFTFFLVLAVSMGIVYASDTQVDGIWYDFDSNNHTASVTYRGSGYSSYLNEYSGEVIIPENITYNGITYSVTSIGNSAFKFCSSLTSVTIPNSVTSIGRYAFDGCSKLTKTNYTGDIAGWCNIKFVSNCANPMYYSHNFYINDQEINDLVIPNSVTSIGDYAFYDCSSLTSITIPNSVTSIGDRAFYGCSKLTSVTIGESLTSIGHSAFYECYFLTSITCKAATPPTIGSTYTFYYVSTSIPVYVPCGCVEAYKAASGWKKFTNIKEPLAEYSIEVDVNDTIMGTAKVDRNSACGNQISATPKFGYHFVQWNDGNTDTNSYFSTYTRYYPDRRVCTIILWSMWRKPILGTD